MLFERVGVPFVLEHLQSGDQLGAREARLDDLVNVAARGGDVGVIELPGVFGDQLAAARMT